MDLKNKPKSFPPQHQNQQPGKESKMTPKPEAIRDNYIGAEKLKGKVALITGGDSGIGRSVAIHFAREGADVAIVYKPEEQKDADETKHMVEVEGSKCLLLAGDLRDENFCSQIVENTVKEFGKINILVNNAAEQHPTDEIEDILDDDMVNTFTTNIFSFIRVTRAAMKHLKEGDCIINTTSVTAYRGSHHLIDYASTKGAIVAFTRSLSASLAEKNIRVNAVAPGPIWTPLIPATFDEKQVAEFGKKVPMKRAGQPSEVGPSYVFLASEDSSYFTGQVLHPNGGEMVNG